MINKKLTKRCVISVCLTVLILIINFIVGYFNLENLINSSDTVSNLIGSFGSMILPYIIIAIIIQIIVLVLNFINKQSLNIASLIVEIVYFIFTIFAVTPSILLNLLLFNKLLAYSVFLIFEFLNIYIIVLTIQKIIQCKKGCDKGEK